LVTDYGARANDGLDDSAAIQRAMNASAAGDTIAFPAGTFDIDRELTLKSDRI
jgi:polygalacturonase